MSVSTSSVRNVPLTVCITQCGVVFISFYHKKGVSLVPEARCVIQAGCGRSPAYTHSLQLGAPPPPWGTGPPPFLSPTDVTSGYGAAILIEGAALGAAPSKKIWRPALPVLFALTRGGGAGFGPWKWAVTAPARRSGSAPFCAAARPLFAGDGGRRRGGSGVPGEPRGALGLPAAGGAAAEEAADELGGTDQPHHGLPPARGGQG